MKIWIVKTSAQVRVFASKEGANEALRDAERYGYTVDIEESVLED